MNPVFLNELRQSFLRHNQTLAIVFWCVSVLLLFLLAQVDELRIFILCAPLIILPMLVPPIASGAFAKEYEQQTWQDLFMTRLTNYQVFSGKFLAYLAMMIGLLLIFLPAFLYIYLGSPVDFHFQLYKHYPSLIVLSLLNASLFGIKLLFSSGLFIILAMVCSRYSSTRRVALVWSYISLGLYALFGLAVWKLMGEMYYQSQWSPAFGTRPDVTRMLPGFMENMHLLFSSIIGVGCGVLLWVSLSEQRGYRNPEAGDVVDRNWQPAASRIRQSTR